MSDVESGYPTPPDPQVVDQLIRLGCFAADGHVLAARATATGAERTRIAVAAALGALISQGYLTVTDPEAWPEWINADNPRIPRNRR